MPDANTKKVGYFNSIEGDWNYENFFFEELMPTVEKTYRIKSEKRFRAIAGLSMGGGGSFMYALHRPDLFSSACPLSAYVGPLLDLSHYIINIVACAYVVYHIIRSQAICMGNKAVGYLIPRLQGLVGTPREVRIFPGYNPRLGPSSIYHDLSSHNLHQESK